MNKQVLANKLIRANRGHRYVQSSIILFVTLGATIAVGVTSLAV